MQTERTTARPLVVLYLYAHALTDAAFFPTARAEAGPALVDRYLECCAANAGSLRLLDAQCDIALVTNEELDARVGRWGRRLLDALNELGVERINAEYSPFRRDSAPRYAGSKYMFDAIDAAVRNDESGRRFVFVDCDCIWAYPDRVFATIPTNGIGSLHIPYDWNWDVNGESRATLTGLADRVGLPPSRCSWIGGEFVSGTGLELERLLGAIANVEALLAGVGESLATEEQVLTLVGMSGLVGFHDRSSLVGRVLTGPRHGAINPDSPSSLSLWHLPSEKALSLRRAAKCLESKRTNRLRRELHDPRLRARRFNVEGAPWSRRWIDDGYLAVARCRQALARQANRWHSMPRSPGPPKS